VIQGFKIFFEAESMLFKFFSCFRRARFAFAVMLFFIVGSSVFAANWDLSNEYPANSIHGRTADFFANAVAQKTGGSLTITVHHGAALGYKSVDLFDAVGDGALQSASTSFVFLSGIHPAFQLGSLPFIAADMDETRILNDLARPLYNDIFEKANQTLLVVVPWPVSGIWGKKVMAGPDDLKAVKIRTYDVATTETFANAGAFPVQISWSDVPAQLSTNAIDAVLTSANGGAGAQFWDLQSHFTNVNYTAGMQAIHVNRDAMEALSEQEREAVYEAALEAEAFGWQLAIENLQQDYATLRSHDVIVTEKISPQFAEFLMDAGQPFIKKWLANAGDELNAVYNAYQAEIAK